jgi:DNA invertase Pin-like site-specific DNA recombinase
MRAGIYARISSDRNDTELGVERQLEDCRALCTAKGWTVDSGSEYVDNDISATKGKPRPEYERLLADIESGRIEALAVWDLDRLVRKPLQLEQFLEVCDRAGLSQLGLVGGNVDLASGNGLLVARIKGAVAAEEARKIAERVERRCLQRATEGGAQGGARPFGYEKGGLILVESEAVLIRQAADRILEGGSLTSIAKEWNETGVASSLGGKWTIATVKQILTSPRIAGLRQYKGEILEGVKTAWQPIITTVEHDRLVKILKDPARRQPALNPDRPSPLRGILRCGECGRQLTSMYRHSKRYYGCRKIAGVGGCNRIFIQADPAEAWVQFRLIPWADDPRLRSVLAEAVGVEVEKTKELVAANAADEETCKMWADMLTRHDTSPEEYVRQTKSVRAGIEARHAQMAAMKGQSVLDRLGGSVVKSWDGLTAEDQRAVISALVESITVMSVGRSRPDPWTRMRFQWRTIEMLEDGQMIDEYGNIYRGGIVISVEDLEEGQRMARKWIAAHQKVSAS